MINHYDKNRFISKRTLARMADVSPRTFARYLATKREVLEKFGVSPKAKKLPPQVVRYICEDYCIDLRGSGGAGERGCGVRGAGGRGGEIFFSDVCQCLPTAPQNVVTLHCDREALSKARIAQEPIR